jgi:gliding motility-associated-like protein
VLNVRALPLIDFRATPKGACLPNARVKFDNFSSIPGESTNTLSYAWNFGDASPIVTEASPTHTYNDTSLANANVFLTVKSAYGCVSVDSTIIDFFRKPIASFSTNRDTICQGDSITLINASIPAPGTSSTINAYKWEFGDGIGTSITRDTKAFYRGTGEFRILMVATTTNGCADTATKFVRVFVKPRVDAGKSFLVPEGTMVTLEGKINAPNITYRWSPAAGLNSATVLNPTLRAVNNQTYTLTAIGQGGCTDSDSTTVSIMRAVNVPNAFSPNGDGQNDTWDLRNLADYPSSTIEVFSRYGQSVFLSIGRYTKSWDGTFKGSVLPAGTYYYIIDLKNGTKPTTGYVTIVK